MKFRQFNHLTMRTKKISKLIVFDDLICLSKKQMKILEDYASRRKDGPGPRCPRPDPDMSHPFPRNGPCSGTRWSSRLHVGTGRQLRIHLTGKLPTLDGNCGRAAAAPSRCRSVPAGCHIHRAGRGPETGPYLRQAPRRPGTSPSLSPSRPSRLYKPLELHEGIPTRRVQRRWSTPNHPAALRSGMKMGSDSPG